MEYISSFIDYLKENEKSQRTIDTYLIDIKQFFSFYKKDITTISKADIATYEQFLAKKNLKISSINRKLVTLNQFIRFLNDQHELGITIIVKQKKQQKQNYLEDVLTKNDFEKLVACAIKEKDYRAKAIFYTLYLTGVRVSEMLQLQTSDIEKEYITILGKGSKYRLIFAPPRLRTVWIEYLSERKKTTDSLFSGQKGAINRHTVHHLIKKYAKKAGVSEAKAHAHSFRHLYCKMLIEKGTPIDTVADLAGHSDINTTRIYTRKTKSELLAAVNDL